VLRTPLEFRILARVANEMSSETILVSDDGNRRRLAQQEGFRTRRSLRTLKHLMLAPGQRPPMLVVPDWVPLPSLSNFVFTVALAVIVAGAVLVLVPTMNVTLVPQTNQVARAVDITVDPDAKTADPATGTLPAQVLTTNVDVFGSVPIPADRTAGKDPARGEVMITSRRPQPSTLPKGTVVRVDGGPTFTTDQDVSLPPNIPTRVGITAQDAGSDGNVAPGDITKFEGGQTDNLEVANQRATSGGTDRQARVVTEDDRKKLHDNLLQQAKDKAIFDLRARAGQDRTLPEASLNVTPVSEQYDQQPGAEAEQLTGRLTATGKATVFNNLAYNDLVGQVLARSAGTDSKLSGPPTIGVPGVLAADNGKVKLRTNASAVVERDLNATDIQQALRGKSLRDAREYVGRLTGLAQPPRVDLTPSWAPVAFRINVDVRGPK
jgi:hypothetical protein